MLRGKGDDILQALILTFFLVSGFLVILNLILAGQRNAAFRRAQAAVDEYNWLVKNLKEEKLRNALAMRKELEQRRSSRDIHTEINQRIKQENLGVAPSNRYRPSRDRSGNYLIHPYHLESGRGKNRVLHPLNVWIGFLGRVEAARPDIHVHDLTLETDQNEIPEGQDKRMWACTAKLVLWEPVAKKR